MLFLAQSFPVDILEPWVLAEIRESLTVGLAAQPTLRIAVEELFTGPSALLDSMDKYKTSIDG